MIDIPTGYRELKKGEYLQDGDMRYSYLASDWIPVSKTKNDKNGIKYNPDSRSARHERPIIRKPIEIKPTKPKENGYLYKPVGGVNDPTV